MVDEDDEGVVSIASPDGAWPTIDVLGVAEGKVVKNRARARSVNALLFRIDGRSLSASVSCCNSFWWRGKLCVL